MKAPGKSHREGISFVKLIKMFPDDDAAQAWFETRIWPNGAHCPRCGSTNVLHPTKHKSMTHRCRDCSKRRDFSLKTGTVMEGSKLGYQAWAIALYLATTSLKGVSSMKLHRDLEITQKSAWHLSHRIRKALEAGQPLFAGPVEADETYHGRPREEQAQETECRTRYGRKDRGCGREGPRQQQGSCADGRRHPRQDAKGFVEQHSAKKATVYTDDARAYIGIKRDHESVKHSVGEYVRDMAHTNGIESFWATLKRAHKGTYHKISPKHLDRYVTEFVGRHNNREADTIEQMSNVARGMSGKRLRYADLIADNGLSSGARDA